MAIFSPIEWRNDQSPAINAGNLNRIEQGIYQCSLDTVASAAFSSSGNDLTITIARQSGSDPIVCSYDVVEWLSASAFYSQSHINDCFEEINIMED